MSDPRATRTFSDVVGAINVDQIGYLVPDLEEAIVEWERLLGPRSWNTWTYSSISVPHLGFRGQEGVFEIRIALSGESPQIELIEPVRGPSIYHEWIARRGYGPHHVGVFVNDLAALTAELKQIGIIPVQSGSGYGLDGDGGFAYFEIGDDADTVFELIEPPMRRRPPVVMGAISHAQV